MRLSEGLPLGHRPRIRDAPPTTVPEVPVIRVTLGDHDGVSELGNFLLERIAEDSECASRAIRGPWTWGDTDLWGFGAWPYERASRRVLQTTDAPEDQLAEWSREHMARWDPYRVANECGAKRAIVQQAIGWLATASRSSADRSGLEDAAILAEQFLKSLAWSYSEHPDFQEEWRS